jgi:hypothetical protein
MPPTAPQRAATRPEQTTGYRSGPASATRAPPRRRSPRHPGRARPARSRRSRFVTLRGRAGRSRTRFAIRGRAARPSLLAVTSTPVVTKQEVPTWMSVKKLRSEPTTPAPGRRASESSRSCRTATWCGAGQMVDSCQPSSQPLMCAPCPTGGPDPGQLGTPEVRAPAGAQGVVPLPSCRHAGTRGRRELAQVAQNRRLEAGHSMAPGLARAARAAPRSRAVVPVAVEGEEAEVAARSRLMPRCVGRGGLEECDQGDDAPDGEGGTLRGVHGGAPNVSANESGGPRRLLLRPCRSCCSLATGPRRGMCEWT